MAWRTMPQSGFDRIPHLPYHIMGRICVQFNNGLAYKSLFQIQAMSGTQNEKPLL